MIVNYASCVQRGAIIAKGGRLTPPVARRRALHHVTFG